VLCEVRVDVVVQESICMSECVFVRRRQHREWNNNSVGSFQHKLSKLTLSSTSQVTEHPTQIDFHESPSRNNYVYV
jgi:hypothetical protein